MTMTNEQIQALKAQMKRKHRDWSATVMRTCDYCGDHKDTVTEEDGSNICASCCDDKHAANLENIAETLLDEREADKAMIAEYDDALCKLLPGVQYMDPPDGGQVEPIEQVARMVADYRQQIAEQAKSIAKLERALDLARNSNSVLAIRSELEARTLTVKLPKPHAHLIWIQAGNGPDDYWDDVSISRSEEDRCCDGSERYPVYSIFEIQEACAAVGIKLDVGE